MTRITHAKELAYRAGDGVGVALLWSPSDGWLTVVVDDVKTCEHLELAARADNALDVFYHPYADASSSAPALAA